MSECLSYISRVLFLLFNKILPRVVKILLHCSSTLEFHRKLSRLSIHVRSSVGVSPPRSVHTLPGRSHTRIRSPAASHATCWNIPLHIEWLDTRHFKGVRISEHSERWGWTNRSKLFLGIFVLSLVLLPQHNLMLALPEMYWKCDVVLAWLATFPTAEWKNTCPSFHQIRCILAMAHNNLRRRSDLCQKVHYINDTLRRRHISQISVSGWCRSYIWSPLSEAAFLLLFLDVMHCLPLLNNSSDVCQWNLYMSLAVPLNMTDSGYEQQMLQLINYRVSRQA